MPFTPRLEPRWTPADPTHTIMDAERLRSQAPARAAIDKPLYYIRALADRARAEENRWKIRAIQECLLGHLDALARARSLEGSVSATDFFYTNWVIGQISVALLKTELPPPYQNDPKLRNVKSWIRRLCEQSKRFLARRLAQGRLQNHLAWGAFALGSAGVVLSDESYVSTARLFTQKLLGAVDANGLVQAETRRGAKALHYHIFLAEAVAGTLLITDSTVTRGEQASFNRLAAAISDGLSNRKTSRIRRLAGVPQSLSQNLGGLHIIGQAIRCNVRLKRSLARLARDYDKKLLFLGGDLEFLLNRTTTGPCQFRY